MVAVRRVGVEEAQLGQVAGRGAVLVLELDAVLVVGADDELAAREDVVVVALCETPAIDE